MLIKIFALPLVKKEFMKAPYHHTLWTEVNIRCSNFHDARELSRLMLYDYVLRN